MTEQSATLKQDVIVTGQHLRSLTCSLTVIQVKTKMLQFDIEIDFLKIVKNDSLQKKAVLYQVQKLKIQKNCQSAKLKNFKFRGDLGATFWFP